MTKVEISVSPAREFSDAVIQLRLTSWPGGNFLAREMNRTEAYKLINGILEILNASAPKQGELHLD